MSDSLLHEAAANGDTNKVQDLLTNGADVHARDDVGKTPLHLAAVYGHKQTAQVLIANGADVHAKDHEGWNPLLGAAMNGHKETAQVLLTNGADVNAKEKYGMTPLLWAARYGHKEMAQILLSNGADVDAKVNDGVTPLHYAARYGHPETAQVLITNGADVNAKDKNDDTPLHWAAKDGHAEVAQFLVASGADVNANNENGKTPLHLAGRKGHTATAEVLATKGADVNAKEKYGMTPLHWAVKSGHKETAQVLITHGADVRAKGNCGTTPLDNAEENAAMRQILLMQDQQLPLPTTSDEGNGSGSHHTQITQGVENQLNPATVPSPSSFKRTPSSMVVSMGAKEEGRRDGNSSSALMDSAVEGKGKSSTGSSNVVVTTTAGGGEGPTTTSDLPSPPGGERESSNTPLHEAARDGNTKMVQYLITTGADVQAKNENGDAPLHHAAHNGHKETAQVLLTTGADPDVKNRNDMTPLHLAAHNGHRETAQVILFNGADVNAKNDDGWTPLQWAAFSGRKETVQVLLNGGADVHAKDDDGWTALHWAATQGHKETAQILVTNGADVNVNNDDGDTPRDLAAQWCHTETAQVLVTNGAAGPTAPSPGGSGHHTQITQSMENHAASASSFMRDPSSMSGGAMVVSMGAKEGRRDGQSSSTLMDSAVEGRGKSSTGSSNVVVTTTAGGGEGPTTTTTPHTLPSQEGGAATDSIRKMIQTGQLQIQRKKPLGRGSFGAVYPALLASGETVAVKELNKMPLNPKQFSIAVDSLQQEMNIMDQITHPNVVHYYALQVDHDECSAKVFMELVTGGSLGEMSRAMETPMAEPLVQNFIRQAMEGLAHVHGKGIAHRDLKGDNILLTTTGQVKLADFGTAKAVGGEAGAAQTMVGTFFFMAPEVLNADDDEEQPRGYGIKADVWSMGITTAELLNCGKHPWPKFKNQRAALAHISESLPVLEEGWSPQCKDFIRKACTRDPQERASAEELLMHPWLSGGSDNSKVGTLKGSAC